MSSDWTGDKIRLRRLDLGLSQGELAKRAGFSQGYVSLLERGKSSSPEALEALASALGLEPLPPPDQRPTSTLAFKGPHVPSPRMTEAGLSVQTWVRPPRGGDLILVCPAGPRSTVVFALDVAGHGAAKHAVATWVAGWVRGRLAWSPGVPRMSELWAGLHDELYQIDERAAFFLAIIQRHGDSHRVRYEGLTDGYPPPLLLVGAKSAALDSCVPLARVRGPREPATMVHEDLAPPWRLAIASDGLLYRTGGGVEQSGLRWIRRWQTGPSKDVPLEQQLKSPAAPSDDESMAIVRWNEWDLETSFDPNDYASHGRMQAAVQGMASSLSSEERERLAQALCELLSNVASYAAQEMAELRVRRLDDGSLTVQVHDRGRGPSAVDEGTGLRLVRELVDHLDIRASGDQGTVVEFEIRPGDHRDA